MSSEWTQPRRAWLTVGIGVFSGGASLIGSRPSLGWLLLSLGLALVALTLLHPAGLWTPAGNKPASIKTKKKRADRTPLASEAKRPNTIRVNFDFVIAVLGIVSIFLLVTMLLGSLYAKFLEWRSARPKQPTEVATPKDSSPTPPSEGISQVPVDGTTSNDGDGPMKSTTPSLIQICNELEKMRPLRRSGAAKPYIGLRVSWRAKIASIGTDFMDDSRAKIIADVDDNGRYFVSVRGLSATDPYILLLDQGDPIWVTGAIASIDISAGGHCHAVVESASIHKVMTGRWEPRVPSWRRTESPATVDRVGKRSVAE
jgi:hypothetical protein